jgi:hypothetical protein
MRRKASQVKGNWILAAAALTALSMTAASADSAAHQKKVLETKDLIGFWAFEDNFLDATTNKNDAKTGGPSAAQVTFTTGANGGRAMFIDNTKDEHNFVEVNTPLGSIFDKPNITIVYWARPTLFRPAVNGDGDPDTDKWNSLVDRHSLWYTELNTVAETDPAVARLVVRLYDPGDGSGSSPQIGREVEADNAKDFYIKVNEWHQFAMSFDGAKVVSYVDGKVAQEYEYEGLLGPVEGIDVDATHPWNLTWGLWKQDSDDYTGAFDDTAYFGRALTPDEVKGLYDAMVAPAPTAGG